MPADVPSAQFRVGRILPFQPGRLAFSGGES